MDILYSQFTNSFILSNLFIGSLGIVGKDLKYFSNSSTSLIIACLSIIVIFKVLQFILFFGFLFFFTFLLSLFLGFFFLFNFFFSLFLGFGFFFEFLGFFFFLLFFFFFL